MEPLKPVGEQVMVVTGASRGIGRELAVRAARKGARVVLAARDGEALDDLAMQIRSEGGSALPVTTDVSDPAQVDMLAWRAHNEFGRIDTWVNNAAVTVYGTFEQITPEEFRRVIDVNFMGQVYGARSALPYLKQQPASALICVGSVLSDRSVPLQSAYSSSKHAIKGLAESLRVEQAMEGTGVQVTLVKPSSINTPLFEEARTKLGHQPKPVDPVYDVGIAADGILHCAEHRERELVIGGGGKLLDTLEAFAGPLLDWYQLRTTPQSQMTDAPKSADAPDNLEQPLPTTRRAAGVFPARRFSVYTSVRRHPRIAAAGMALGVIGLRRALHRNGSTHRDDAA